MNKQTPRLAFDLEQDLRALSAMASNLTPYLYEQEMYGHLSGSLPKLTLGGLLLRLFRLSHLEDLSADQRTMVQDARINFEAARSEWAVHYKAKLEQEIEGRLQSLEQYLQECNEDPHSCVASYPIEAEKRTMVEHLREECTEFNCLSEKIEQQLVRADSRLERTLERSGEFIMDPRLQSVYPASRFWWLYGRIREDRR